MGVKVVDAGSFSVAARRLGMPKSSGRSCAPVGEGKTVRCPQGDGTGASGTYFLPRIARAYAAKYPDVSFELIVTDGPWICDLVNAAL